MNELRLRHYDVIDESNKFDFDISEDITDINEASQKCATITIEYMKGFAEWIPFKKVGSNNWLDTETYCYYSTYELIQLYFNSLNNEL